MRPEDATPLDDDETAEVRTAAGSSVNAQWVDAYLFAGGYVLLGDVLHQIVDADPSLFSHSRWWVVRAKYAGAA